MEYLLTNCESSIGQWFGILLHRIIRRALFSARLLSARQVQFILNSCDYPVLDVLNYRGINIEQVNVFLLSRFMKFLV